MIIKQWRAQPEQQAPQQDEVVSPKTIMESDNENWTNVRENGKNKRKSTMTENNSKHPIIL